MIYPAEFDTYKRLLMDRYNYSSIFYRDLKKEQEDRILFIKEFEEKNPDAKYYLCKFYIENYKINPWIGSQYNATSLFINLKYLNPGYNIVIKNYGS